MGIVALSIKSYYFIIRTVCEFSGSWQFKIPTSNIFTIYIIHKVNDHIWTAKTIRFQYSLTGTSFENSLRNEY